VPRSCAYQVVTVKAYTDRLEVVAGGQVVARHGRSYGRDEQVLDPLHYLASLERRPAALDHAAVLRDWKLPEPFARLRQALQDRHGTVAGARQYIRVLQLLADHPVERVRQAVEDALRRDEPDAERIRTQVLRLAHKASDPDAQGSHPPGEPPSLSSKLSEYQVPRPDLGQFDRLLSKGEGKDDGE
jgi:hypothetical protein